MTIRKKQTNSDKIVIDLTGPAGNAFNLIGIVQATFNRSGQRQLGDSIVQEMMSGDYEHLLQIFDLHLGDRYILER